MDSAHKHCLGYKCRDICEKWVITFRLIKQADVSIRRSRNYQNSGTAFLAGVKIVRKTSYCIVYCIAFYCIVLYGIVFYPMSWKIQPIRGQDYRCIFCGMQRVVFYSTFPSLLARNSLLGSIWGLLKSQLRNSSTPANHYEHFRSHLEIFRRFPNTSEDFRRFSKKF